jgi:hypothetical protein
MNEAKNGNGSYSKYKRYKHYKYYRYYNYYEYEAKHERNSEDEAEIIVDSEGTKND